MGYAYNHVFASVFTANEVLTGPTLWSVQKVQERTQTVDRERNMLFFGLKLIQCNMPEGWLKTYALYALREGRGQYKMKEKNVMIIALKIVDGGMSPPTLPTPVRLYVYFLRNEI